MSLELHITAHRKGHTGASANYFTVACDIPDGLPDAWLINTMKRLCQQFRLEVRNARIAERIANANPLTSTEEE